MIELKSEFYKWIGLIGYRTPTEYNFQNSRDSYLEERQDTSAAVSSTYQSTLLRSVKVPHAMVIVILM